MHARFVVDIMLGRLARWLRVMGYDTLYPGPAPGHAGDRRLLQIARSEARVLVTRDRMLARLAADRGCWIRAESPDEQIVEVVTGLQLAPREGDRLSRCLDCNAPLEARDKAAVAGRVPDHVLATQSAFKACPACSKIYWAGTHVERMLARLDRLVGAG